ncbi:hypothetical protein MBLNU457_5520t2 [Dothideomycetes sp. NU457]
MAQSLSRAASVGRPESAVSSVHSHVQKPGYKVQLEHVVAKKRKLNVTDTHITQPPPGYTFLAVGYADLAERCKELSRKRGVDVRLVSAQNKSEAAHKISTHLHRIGYHFQSDVFDQACDELGYRFQGGKLVRDSDASAAAGFDRVMARFGADFGQASKKSATAEEEIKVKKAIRELFPKIPDDALHEIFRKAWQEGAETVGNAPLPLSRRVQLATVAHIRHKFTEYDRLLKILTWPDARKIVEPRCLEKLVEWRGDNEDHGDEVEDIVRETIVIDDEDNVVSREDEGNGTDTSYEVVARSTRHEDIAAESSDDRPSAGEPLCAARPAAASSHSDLTNHRELTRNRWHEAQVRVHGVKTPFTPCQQSTPPSGHIRVEANAQGRLPRKILQDGIEYVRLSPDREVIEPVSLYTNPQYSAYGLGTPANHPQRYGYNPYPQHHPQAVTAPVPPPRASFATPSQIGNGYERIIQSIERSRDFTVPGQARESDTSQGGVVPNGSGSKRRVVEPYGKSSSASPPRRKRRRAEIDERGESDYEPPSDIVEVARRNDPRRDPVQGRDVQYYGQPDSGSSDKEYDPAKPALTTASANYRQPDHGLHTSQQMVYQSRGMDTQHHDAYMAPQSQHGAPSAVQPKQYHGDPHEYYQQQYTQYAAPRAASSHQVYAAPPAPPAPLPPPRYAYPAPYQQQYLQYPPVYAYPPP